MPRYDYRCPACGVYEADGRRDERQIECHCGRPATRLPFSGVPYLKGSTMPKQIPDPVYREDAEKRVFEQTWGPEERVVEMMRANLVEDKEGHKSVNTKAMSET